MTSSFTMRSIGTSLVWALHPRVRVSPDSGDVGPPFGVMLRSGSAGSISSCVPMEDPENLAVPELDESMLYTPADRLVKSWLPWLTPFTVKVSAPDLDLVVKLYVPGVYSLVILLVKVPAISDVPPVNVLLGVCTVRLTPSSTCGSTSTDLFTRSPLNLLSSGILQLKLYIPELVIGEVLETFGLSAAICVPFLRRVISEILLAD